MRCLPAPGLWPLLPAVRGEAGQGLKREKNRAKGRKLAASRIEYSTIQYSIPSKSKVRHDNNNVPQCTRKLGDVAGAEVAPPREERVVTPSGEWLC